MKQRLFGYLSTAWSIHNASAAWVFKINTDNPAAPCAYRPDVPQLGLPAAQAKHPCLSHLRSSSYPSLRRTTQFAHSVSLTYSLADIVTESHAPILTCSLIRALLVTRLFPHSLTQWCCVTGKKHGCCSLWHGNTHTNTWTHTHSCAHTHTHSTHISLCFLAAAHRP